MRSLVTVLSVVVLAGACDSATDVPEDPPDVAGIVTRMAESASYDFMVDASPPYDPGPFYAIKVDGSTRVMKLPASGDLREGRLSDIAVGRDVTIWLRGPIVSGDTLRATADVILISAIQTN